MFKLNKLYAALSVLAFVLVVFGLYQWTNHMIDETASVMLEHIDMNNIVLIRFEA